MPGFEPVRFAALKDVGVKRSHNQDDFAVQPAADEAGWEANGHVFVVADGMGGHAVGEKASAKAVRDIPFLYLKHARDGVVPALRRAFQETNAGIFAVGQENPEFRGMGTTSTALILRPEGAWVGHVGDSRAYRIRTGKVEQLTFDHSWVWEIAKRQGIDPDELGDFKKNVIIRSLGPDPEVEVDIEGPHPIQPGDAFLLCSDGLTGVVTPDEIGAVVSVLPPEEAARLLVNLANLRGGPDNITVLIVEVAGGSGDPTPKKVAGPNPIRKLAEKWVQRVPWPFTVIGVGCGLAALSLGLQAAEVPGSVVLFIISAAVILTGLAGLIAHFRQEQPTQVDVADEGPRTLNIHKKHECTVTRALSERFAQIEAALAEAMKSQNAPVDWEGFAKAAAISDADAKKGDVITAFRSRCRSLLLLSDAFHKARQKAELFRPNWDRPAGH